MSWNRTLASAGPEQTLSRAHSVLNKKTKYTLGKGGFDPSLPLSRECDCSGFIAWAIGFPRELPPGSGHWLSTDEYYKGGVAGKTNLFIPVKLAEAVVGDLFVYPDIGGHQGHIALINQVDEHKPSYIIHCSSGNWQNFGDAIRITNPAVFLNSNHEFEVVRINYQAIKDFADVTAVEV